MKQTQQGATYYVTSTGHHAIVEEYTPSSMVIRTLNPTMELTQEQVTMLEEANQHPITYDNDSPELTPAMARAFREAAMARDARKQRVIHEL